MNLTLRVWRQKNAQEKGRLETYQAHDVNEDMSFLEMLDVVNEDLIKKGVEPVHFDPECREGICGACSRVINGISHGGKKGCTTCELRMRHFKDGDTITIEPFRAKAFPIVRDLMVDRSALDRVIQAGGFVSVNTGGTPDANAIPINKEVSDTSMDFAACIGCGACVAACKNASAMLFVSAKVGHLAILPQGQVEREQRVNKMVAQMDIEGFGNCTNYYECEAVCPKEISVKSIAQMNREFMRALVK